MAFREQLTNTSTDHPIRITLLMLFLCLGLALQIPNIKIDTDPENMLSEDESVRVFHNQVKKEFTLYDMIVLGVVNEDNPDGVFNPETLAKIFQLTRQIEQIEGVIPIDLLAPSKVDDIQQAGLGTVRFEWLMSKPPETREEALRIRDRAKANPMLYGTLLSEDGKALCLYIPIEAKDMSYRIASQIRDFTERFAGEEQYHITGLPVAEDTFGVEMFKQMAVSAPLAGLFIFILMWFFFRNAVLILSAMIVAVVTVLCTMGLLIGTGHTVHIMSSMIPIFLMPIAVVDSIHILSEFFDRYPHFKDRRKTIHYVMQDLFNPMLFTSLTSTAGFASLALTPIPPVRVFGLFVAFGIMLAWFLTITFIPAYVMLLKESSLEKFGRPKDITMPSLLERLLEKTGVWTYRRSKWILTVTGIVLVLAVIGITTIVVNDNPVKWFEDKHPIRVADRVLNEHFGGTYMAYLVLDEKSDATALRQSVIDMEEALARRVEETRSFLPAIQQAGKEAQTLLRKQIESQKREQNGSLADLLWALEKTAGQKVESKIPEIAEAWEELGLFFNEQRVRAQPFKKPEVLRYVQSLQQALLETGVVGKSSSVVDVIRKVHYELMEGDKEFDRIPDTAPAVAQTLLSYQNSHDPDDLWHLVTPDYQKANLWIQLQSGDNRDMEKVAKSVDRFFEENAPPIPLSHNWAGLTYLNVIWQEKMVRGMIRSLSGSFIIVLLMVVFLFRSPLWGLLCMVPLTVTILFIYGMIGFAGKEYDMPIAVLSAMTLGLSVDFAIHFLERSRQAYSDAGNDWQSASGRMFGEPGRAISRNILVIAIGFTPLMIAPLVPYKTVGFFLAAIMFVSGAATLIILPALIRTLRKMLFEPPNALQKFCRPATCVTTSFIAILIITYGIQQFGVEGWQPIVWVVAFGIVAAALICHFLSRRKPC